MKRIKKDAKKIVLNERPKDKHLIESNPNFQEGKINPNKKYQVNITKDMPFTIKIF